MAAALGLWACHLEGPETREHLRWDLKDSLARYDSVQVVILDAADTAVVLETVFAGKLASNADLPEYSLEKANGKDFTIRISGYDDGLLVYRNDIARQGGVFTPHPVPESALPGVWPLLTGLSLSQGKLKPDFHRDSLAYAVEVESGDSSLSLTPFAQATVVHIAVKGDSVASGSASRPVRLQVGDNELEVRLKAKSGKERTYFLKVTRARPIGRSALLSGLSLSSGALTPVFHRDTLGYKSVVNSDDRTILLTATALDGFATVCILPAEGSRGGASRSLTLQEGTNRVTVRVVAEDTAVSRLYTLSITVPPNPAP
jgi:hypothetical protein